LKRSWLGSTFRTDGYLVVSFRYLEHRLFGVLVRKILGLRPRFFGSVPPLQGIVRR